MNKLYIGNYGRVLMDENGDMLDAKSDYGRIDDLFLLDEDAKIIYKKGEANIETEAKAGDIVITFYGKDFTNKVVVVKNDDWAANIKAERIAEQKRKEEWAIKQSCGECKCEC